MLVTFFTLQNGTKNTRLENNEITVQSTEAQYRLNKLRETSYSILVKKSLIITNVHHFE